MKTHLIMPMGGAGSRFKKNGYIQPKPLIKIEGKPFFYWAAMSIKKFVDLEDMIFVVLQQHIEENGIDNIIKKFFPDAKIEVLPKVLPGSVYTCLEGIKNVFDDNPVIVNDCDHMFKCSSINEMLNTSSKLDFDGALLTFRSDEPQFSYVKYNSKGNIIGTIEKVVLSDRAICGAYIFKNANIIRKAAQKYIGNCLYNECFMSGLYNIIYENGGIIKDYLLDYHVEFGTPAEYKNARKSALFKELL